VSGRLLRAVAGVYPGGSGPRVALVFTRLFALVVIVAWWSLAAQVRLLIGEEGLLPLRPVLASLRAEGPLPILDYPSLLRWPALAADGVLAGGAVVGVLLGVLALAGVAPRVCFALSTALYLSYAYACRTFLGFQWDNLLLECGLLALFLSTRRPAPLAHLAFRLLLWKLYFESGIAKWQSPLHDWHDGSAMTFYYQTAPLPTRLAWYAHNLPAAWHHLESRATLLLELGLPFAIFGPRRARLAAATGFTAFQLANAATANYGFFCYLAAALHVFLLDEGDVGAWLGRLRARLPPRLGVRLLGAAELEPSPPLPAPAARRLLALGGLATFLVLSTIDAIEHFGRDVWREALLPVERLYGPWRLVNTYHLFASITRERVEPQLETFSDGRWTPQDLAHKPGDPLRSPDYVAPHQPRVDFQLWFYAFGWQRARPAWVENLLQRLCYAPAVVQPLFPDRLPEAPSAVRLVFYRYEFTTRDERRATGAVWRRILVGTSREVSCDR
jgi:hypothetical protein